MYYNIPLSVDGSVKVCILGDTSEAESFLLQSSQSQNEDSDTEEDKHRNEESNRVSWWNGATVNV